MNKYGKQKKYNIKKLVEDPSLGAIFYQSCTLISELEYINDEEYSPEACQIRDVFLCIATYVSDQLWELLNHDVNLLNDQIDARIKALAGTTRTLYSFIRYLKSSLLIQSPPGIQVALTQLTERYFPNNDKQKPVCVVRPQWKYNLQCVLLTWDIRNLVNPGSIDPDFKMQAENSDEMLRILWDKWCVQFSKEQPKSLPKQMAILSFAGLDTYDALLYALLAHELGHFIDYSFDHPLNKDKSLVKSSSISFADFLKVIETFPQENLSITAKEVDDLFYELESRLNVCLREIIADLLALRMMGLSFFISQAEFLKTLGPWPKSDILETGYPGFRFRLQVVLDYLEEMTYSNKKLAPHTLLSFLEKYSEEHEQICKPLQQYLFIWQKRLAKSSDIDTSLKESLNQLIYLAVNRSLPIIKKLVRHVIPDSKCARLTTNFFKRIEYLQNDLPPSCPNETHTSFAEIMSASWVYEILFGEQKELALKTKDEQLAEYKKTCRLVLKSIELIPLQRRIQKFKPSKFANKRKKSEPVEQHGVLDGYSIYQRIFCCQPTNPLHLAVIPKKESAIQSASLDVHLGNWFAFARRTKLRTVTLDNKKQERLLMTLGREEVFTHSSGTFIIHPGDLILGTTLEFIGLPGDVMAFVEGKSRLGRLGLIVATATQVAPGFHGVVVLELANTGTVPLELVPGMAIAQLIFQNMTKCLPKDKSYDGKYQCQIKPCF